MGIGVIASDLTPRGDALVECVGAVFAAALGGFELSFEDIDDGVEAIVLMGRTVADALAVGGIVLENRFQSAVVGRSQVWLAASGHDALTP